MKKVFRTMLTILQGLYYFPFVVLWICIFVVQIVALALSDLFSLLVARLKSKDAYRMRKEQLNPLWFEDID